MDNTHYALPDSISCPQSQSTRSERASKKRKLNVREPRSLNQCHSRLLSPAHRTPRTYAHQTITQSQRRTSTEITGLRTTFSNAPGAIDNAGNFGGEERAYGSTQPSGLRVECCGDDVGTELPCGFAQLIERTVEELFDKWWKEQRESDQRKHRSPKFHEHQFDNAMEQEKLSDESAATKRDSLAMATAPNRNKSLELQSRGSVKLILHDISHENPVHDKTEGFSTALDRLKLSLEDERQARRTLERKVYLAETVSQEMLKKLQESIKHFDRKLTDAFATSSGSQAGALSDIGRSDKERLSTVQADLERDVHESKRIGIECIQSQGQSLLSLNKRQKQLRKRQKLMEDAHAKMARKVLAIRRQCNRTFKTQQAREDCVNSRDLEKERDIMHVSPTPDPDREITNNGPSMQFPQSPFQEPNALRHTSRQHRTCPNTTNGRTHSITPAATPDQLDNFTTRLAELEATRDVIPAQLHEQLTSSQDTLRKNVEQAIKYWKTENEEQNASLEATCEELRNSQDWLADSLSHLPRTVIDLGRKMQTVEDMANNLGDRYKEDLASLESQVAKNTANFDDLREKLSRMSSQLATISSQYDVLREQVAFRESQLATHSSDSNLLREQLARLEFRLARVSSGSDVLCDQLIHKSQVSTNSSDFDRLHERLIRLEAQLGINLVNPNSDFHEQFNRLESQVASSSADYSRLREQVTHIESELALDTLESRLCRRFMHLEYQQKGNTANIDHLRAQVHRTESQLASKSADFDSLRKDVADAKSTLLHLEDQGNIARPLTPRDTPPAMSPIDSNTLRQELADVQNLLLILDHQRNTDQQAFAEIKSGLTEQLNSLCYEVSGVKNTHRKMHMDLLRFSDEKARCEEIRSDIMELKDKCNQRNQQFTKAVASVKTQDQRFETREAALEANIEKVEKLEKHLVGAILCFTENPEYNKRIRQPQAELENELDTDTEGVEEEDVNELSEESDDEYSDPATHVIDKCHDEDPESDYCPDNHMSTFKRKPQTSSPQSHASGPTLPAPNEAKRGRTLRKRNLNINYEIPAPPPTPHRRKSGNLTRTVV